MRAKIIELEAEGEEEESSSEEGSSEEESEEEEEEEEPLPFHSTQLMIATFKKPGSLGLTYVPKGKQTVVGRVMPGSQATKSKKKIRPGYVVCKIGDRRVLEVGSNKFQQILKKHTTRPVMLTLANP